MKTNNIHYFAGCNSPVGFYSYFDELYTLDGKDRAFIIKGGAGTGKSSLMKSIAAIIESKGYNVEYVHCSSDSDSLDAIVMPELNSVVLDGTLPHAVEPKYPGAVETIINLGSFWNETALRENSRKIINLSDECSLCHKKSIHYLSIAGQIKEEIKALDNNTYSVRKIESYCDRFAKRTFPKAQNKIGKGRNLFLSSITPKGNIIYPQTLHSYAKTIIGIEDKTGFCSDLIIGSMKDNAIKNGLDVIEGFCPLSPKESPEQLIIPKASICFIRLHSRWKNCAVTRKIHCNRFKSEVQNEDIQNKLSFYDSILNELISQTAKQLKKAKSFHDELEKVYISQMDFKSFGNLAFIISEKILSN